MERETPGIYILRGRIHTSGPQDGGRRPGCTVRVDHCAARAQWGHVVHDELKIAMDFLLAKIQRSIEEEEEKPRYEEGGAERGKESMARARGICDDRKIESCPNRRSRKGLRGGGR